MIETKPVRAQQTNKHSNETKNEDFHTNQQTYKQSSTTNEQSPQQKQTTDQGLHILTAVDTAGIYVW